MDTLSVKKNHLVPSLDNPEMLQPTSINLLLGNLAIFQFTTDEKEIKEQVKRECNNVGEEENEEIFDACQALMFTSLMVDFEEENLMDQTITLISSTIYRDLVKNYLNTKTDVKESAREFLEATYLQRSEEVHCNRPHRPLLDLNKEQRERLFSYADYLRPGLALELKEKEVRMMRKCAVLISGGLNDDQACPTRSRTFETFPPDLLQSHSCTVPSFTSGKDDHTLDVFGEKTLVSCGGSWDPDSSEQNFCLSWTKGSSQWQAWQQEDFLVGLQEPARYTQDNGTFLRPSRSIYDVKNQKILFVGVGGLTTLGMGWGAELPGGRTFQHSLLERSRGITSSCLITTKNFFYITGGKQNHWLYWYGRRVRGVKGFVDRYSPDIVTYRIEHTFFGMPDL